MVKIHPVGAGLGTNTAVEGYYLIKIDVFMGRKTSFSQRGVRGVAEPVLLQQQGLCSGHSRTGGARKSNYPLTYLRVHWQSYLIGETTPLMQ